MVWASPAQWFQLLHRHHPRLQSPGRAGLLGLLPQLFTPGGPSLAVSHGPGNHWYSDLFIGILLQSCCWNSWQDSLQQQEVVFAWPLFLAQSLPGWHKGWGSEHPGLCSCPQTIPWMRSQDDDGGGIFCSFSDLLTQPMVGKGLVNGQSLEKTSSGPVSLTILKQPCSSVSLLFLNTVSSKVVKCSGRIQRKFFHCLLLLLIKVRVLCLLSRSWGLLLFWQMDNGRHCRKSTLTWLGIWPDAS